MRYKDYLQSEHWSSFKKTWYSENRNTVCAICGSNNFLQVHHKRYKNRSESVLGNESINKDVYPKEDVITLCGNCHQLLHSLKLPKYIGIIKIKIIRFLMENGYSKPEAFNFKKTNKKKYDNLSKKFALERLNQRRQLAAVS